MTSIASIKEPVFNIMQRAKQRGVTFKSAEIMRTNLDTCSSDIYWVITGSDRGQSHKELVLELRNILKEMKHRFSKFGITVNQSAENLDLITETFRSN